MKAKALNTKKFFDCIDKLPVVKLLQVTAAALLALMALQIVISFGKLFSEPFLVLETFWNGSANIIVGTVHALFQPVILLGLAEIVKAKKE